MTHDLDAYMVTLEQDEDGRIHYRLDTPDHPALFEGCDWRPGPEFEPTSREAACCLLSFLVLNEDDIDESMHFFDNHTPEQMEWLRGPDRAKLVARMMGRSAE